MVLILAQFLAFSVLATDAAQTQHYLPYTRDNPYQANGYYIYESGLMEGRPEGYKQMNQTQRVMVAAAPDILAETTAFVSLAAFASYGLRIVTANNRNNADLGLPQYYMLGYEWAF